MGIKKAVSFLKRLLSWYPGRDLNPTRYIAYFQCFSDLLFDGVDFVSLKPFTYLNLHCKDTCFLGLIQTSIFW